MYNFNIDKSKSPVSECQRVQAKKDKLTNYVYKKDEIEDIKDELQELAGEVSISNLDGIKAELGDVVLTLCRLANKYDIDLEESTTLSTKKFCGRWNYVSKHLKSKGKSLKDIDKHTLKVLWNKAKKSEKLLIKKK